MNIKPRSPGVFCLWGWHGRYNKAHAHCNGIFSDLQESQNLTEKNEGFTDFRIRSIYKMTSS